MVSQKLNSLRGIIVRNSKISEISFFVVCDDIWIAKWPPVIVVMTQINCRTPTLAKCGGEAQHLEKLGIWSPPGLLNVQSSTARGKTPCFGVFLVSLERS
jgi:hypothetical protein